MRTRRLLLRHGQSAVALLLATSCVDQRPAPATPRPLRAAETKRLFKALVPGLTAPELAQLATSPASVAPLPAQAIVAAPPFLGLPASADDGARATQCLTAAVYYEARSEPLDGQRAVAQVVLNRVRDRAFPHSVCGVVYQGVGRGRGCQFSFACDGSTLRTVEPAAWDRARLVADAALAGSVYAGVGDATFYHTSAVSPWWAPSLARIGVIGAHIFYTWPSALQRTLGWRASYTGVEPTAPTAAGAGTAAALAVANAFGVAIHRGSEETATGTAVADPSASATASAPASAPRLVFTSGVRIHRGVARIAGTAALPTMIGGAMVAPENDPG